MNIYLMTDMEGASGVTMWEECRVDSPRFAFGRRMITQDVCAAVEGLLAGGAKRIVVADGHGTGANFLLEELPAGVEYVTGPASAAPMPFLNDSFDAVGVIGQHAMFGTPNAFLAHTQSSSARRGMWINGREVGELGQFATLAGHHGLPVVLVTGDVAVTKEAEALLGAENVETVAVKEACSPTRGLCMALEDAHRAIRDGAKRSLELIGRAKPLKVDPPIEVVVEWQQTSHADAREAAGAERVGPITTRRVVQSALEVFQT